MQATDDALTAEKNAEIAEIATVAARAAVCCLLIRRIGTKLILKAINRRSIENMTALWMETQRPDVAPETCHLTFDITLAGRSPSDPCRAGGDFADVTRHDDGSITFMIGDASAKGDVGRRHAAFLRTSYRAAAAWTREPSLILAAMNAAYYRFLQRECDASGYFATAVVGSLFPDGLMAYGDAGGPPALLFQGNAKHDHLAPTGAVLGISAQGAYADRFIPFGKGQTFLAFTDGVSEARSHTVPHESLGSRGLARISHEYLQRSERLCANSVLRAVARAGFTLRDDATVACCSVLLTQR